MSVEGMWKFQSASAEDPGTLRWGSIIVLETGRVFGGDSAMAHVGVFEVSGGAIVAAVRSWVWNHDLGEVANVFGMTGEIDYMVKLEGAIEGDTIAGVIYPEGRPELRLACRMEKIAELPG